MHNGKIDGRGTPPNAPGRRSASPTRRLCFSNSCAGSSSRSPRISFWRGRCRGQRIALRCEAGDGADAVGFVEQWRVALIWDHEHHHVGAAFAHGCHGRATQDIGIGAAHDHQRHLGHGVELRPQRRKRLVGVEALEGVGERGIVGARPASSRQPRLAAASHSAASSFGNWFPMLRLRRRTLRGSGRPGDVGRWARNCKPPSFDGSPLRVLSKKGPHRRGRGQVVDRSMCVPV